MAKNRHPKEAYYFSHDRNAHNDEKILELRKDHGWEGYGIFWVMIERMSDTTNYQLRHDKISSLAFSLIIEENKLNKWLDDCIEKYKLFASDGESYWSESLNARMALKAEKAKEASKSGKKGSDARWKNKGKKIAPPSSENNTAIPENSKVNQNKGNESKRNVSKSNEIKEKEITINEKNESETKVNKRKPEEIQENESIHEYKKRIEKKGQAVQVNDPDDLLF